MVPISTVVNLVRTFSGVVKMSIAMCLIAEENEVTVQSHSQLSPGLVPGHEARKVSVHC